MGKDYRFVGKKLLRCDAREIVTGNVKYMGDLKFQNLLHGKILRSPHAHAIIRKIDKSKAETLPGVKAVVTWEDIPDWRGGTPRNVRILGSKVRYVGDAVVLIAATTEQIAEEALDLIDVEYEVLPAVFDIDSAIQPGAPQLYDDSPGNILPAGTIIFGPKSLKAVRLGDPQKGFAEADFIAEGTFGYESIPSAIPAESVGAVALWEEPNKATVWGTSQAPSMDKETLYHVFNRQVSVRCIGSHVGGSFGTKVMCWRVQAYAIVLSRATGQPVRVMFTKEEHMTDFTLRIASRIHAKVGIKKDGACRCLTAHDE
jgi:CO/xanthine dehydrogenase Mo-binding subunit